MKLRILSDLHFEHTEHRFGVKRFGIKKLPKSHADVTILAGDIDKHPEDVFELFADWNTPVIYVAGNHEWYRGHDMKQGRPDGVLTKPGNPVVYLENGAYEIDGVRFLGATLWTDYKLMGNTTLGMHAAGSRLNDHRLIRFGDELFSPGHALELHQESVAFLRSELLKSDDKQRVVVTHHGPSFKSVAPRFQHDLLSSAFSSDVEELVMEADLWVHGHTHDSFDYQLGVEPAGRVVCNPRGYPVRGCSAERPRWENEQYNPKLVVTI